MMYKMKSLIKVTRLFTLLSFLIIVSSLQLLAQNTAPVPTTFEILSPSDGNLPFLMNQNWGTGTGQNSRIFYGGDFAPLSRSPVSTNAALGFHVHNSPNAAVTHDEIKAVGNAPLSRLTLGGTEKWYNTTVSEPLYGSQASSGSSLVANLGWRLAITSFDDDDLGGAGYAATWLNYTGSCGFIAINEEDSLVIRLTGYIDPNNRMKYASGGLAAGDGMWGGTLLESEEYVYDPANPGNNGQNGVEFGVVPSTLPKGASFNVNLFTWVPNFIQGDGKSDNSLRNGWYFVDANISDGLTTSQTAANTLLDSTSTAVGRGNGELKDSLYVVYFSATDDGIPPYTGTDSLFILVNDSIANPPPVFTSRRVIDRSGVARTYLQSSTQFTTDSLLTYYEGDSIAITFYATDQDSARGETNDALTFLIQDWDDFLHRTTSAADSLALDTTSVLEGGIVKGFRVRLNLAYNVGDTTSVADTLIVRVTDGTTPVYDTMLFTLVNVNRPPIWDQDTSSKPSDSALTWAYDPAAVDADSIDEFYPLAVSNNATDTIYFQQYRYDPDSLIGDLLGPVIAITESGSPASIFNSSGLMIVNISVVDTASYPFTITATDNDGTNPLSASKDLILRVAPEPEITKIYPNQAAPGDQITIFGSGFGLYDDGVTPPSRVRFRARNASGVAQNLVATINSWSRDRINVTIPHNTPVSQWKPSINDWVFDTLEVNSSVFTSPTYYPYRILALDTTKVTSLEVANLTPTSAVLKWKTEFTGTDSVILAKAVQDTLDIFSTNFAAAGAVTCAFVISSSGSGL